MTERMAGEHNVTVHSPVTKERAGGFCDWSVGVHRYGVDINPIEGSPNVEMVVTEIDTRTSRRRHISALVTPEIAQAITEALNG